MSFAGTVSWMAPEIIRHEPCSEKVDIWSYGVVLWEMLTCEAPYKNLDTNSILFGVGTNKLQLQIPPKFPDGVKLLLQQCWNLKPRNRPTFQQILKHLEIIQNTDILFKSDEKYFIEQNKWKLMINQNAYEDALKTEKILVNEQDLIEKRNEELKHASDIRELYERKLERASDLYFELSTILLQLDAREKEILRKEKLLNINATRKRAVRSLIKRELFCKNTKKNQKHNQPLVSALEEHKTVKIDVDQEILNFSTKKIEEPKEKVTEKNFYSSSETENRSTDDEAQESPKQVKITNEDNKKQHYSPKYFKRTNSLRRSSRKSNGSKKAHQQQPPATTTDDDLDMEDDDHVKRFSLDDAKNRLKYNNSSLSSYYYHGGDVDTRNSTDDCENTSERPHSSNSLEEILDGENDACVADDMITTGATNEVFIGKQEK